MPFVQVILKRQDAAEARGKDCNVVQNATAFWARDVKPEGPHLLAEHPRLALFWFCVKDQSFRVLFI